MVCYTDHLYMGAVAALFRKGNIMSEITINLLLILLIVWILKK